MKLIFSPASPFVRKVRVVIDESGLTDHVTPVPVQTTPLVTDPAARNANPLGKKFRLWFWMMVNPCSIAGLYACI